MRKTWVRLCSTAMLLATASLGVAQLPVEDGLILWLDATDADTLTLDGDFVEQWDDKSGNEYHAFPVSVDSTPIWTADAMNGQPSVRFTGATADGMLMEDFFLDERPYTAFVVNQYWGDTQGRTLQGTDGNNWLLGLWSGQVSHYAEGWVSEPRPLATKDFVYVADATGSEDGSTFFVNNKNVGTVPTPIGVPGSLAIGGGGSFPGEVSDADVSEVIFYDRVLSADELGSMRTYLYDKYQAADFDASIPDPDEFKVNMGTIGTFMSAADLDFSGDFIYAVNVGGPGFDEFDEPLTIGDAVFAGGTHADQPDLDEAGFRMKVDAEGATWNGGADFGGETIDDENLAFAMQSIRWSHPPDGVDIELDVEAGESYKLQMLFQEACCDRGFDIIVEDETAVDNLAVWQVQGEINKTDTGVAFTHEFVAGDDTLNINLGVEFVGVSDHNPILNLITLEKIDAIIGPTCNPDTKGDLDGNGKVEFADFLVLSGNFGKDVPGHAEGDIDCNGKVEFADFLALSGNFGTEVAGAESVPEPSSHLLLVLAALTGMCVRRRR